jgi:hypothetical protein
MNVLNSVLVRFGCKPFLGGTEISENPFTRVRAKAVARMVFFIIRRPDYNRSKSL